VGAKRAYDLFPGPLRSRIKGERKKRFAEEQRAALTVATKAAAAAKVPSYVLDNHSGMGISDGCSSAGHCVTAVAALATLTELPQNASRQLAGHCWRAQVGQTPLTQYAQQPCSFLDIRVLMLTTHIPLVCELTSYSRGSSCL